MLRALGPTRPKRPVQRDLQSHRKRRPSTLTSKFSNHINHFIRSHLKLPWTRIPRWHHSNLCLILNRKDWQAVVRSIAIVVGKPILQTPNNIPWGRIQTTTLCTILHRICPQRTRKQRMGLLNRPPRNQRKGLSIIRRVNLMAQVSTICSWDKPNSSRKQKSPSLKQERLLLIVLSSQPTSSTWIVIH